MLRTRPGSPGTTATCAPSDSPYGATSRSRQRGQLVGGSHNARPFDLEPRCESLWRTRDLGLQFMRRDVAPGRDLVGVCARQLSAAPGVDPAQLVLGELRVVLRLVLELEQEFELCGHAEFLAQAATDRVLHLLATAGMRAAGVGPVARPQAFALRALLQEQFARGIEHEQREPAVQRSAAAVCKDGRIIVAHATIDLIPGKDGAGADGAVVTFVGVGAPWRGTAWPAALAPINLVRRIWHPRPSR